MPVFLGRGVVPVAALALLAACGKAPAPVPPPPEVVVDTVAVRDLPLRLRYPARVAGSRVAEVRARVGGLLVERAYREGEAVRAGQVLFRIEPDSYRAVYQRAAADVAVQRAALAEASANYERSKALVSDGAVSRREFDEAEATWSRAQASLAAAEAAQKIASLDLGYTEVRAPVSGIASKESVTVGNMVKGGGDSGGDLLTTIVQADPAYVEFSIAEPEFLRIRALADDGVVNGRPGSRPVRIVGGALCETTGHLDFADTFVNVETGTVRARAVVPNRGGCLLSGQSVAVELGGLVIPRSIAVPKSAVLFGQGGSSVWVVGADGKAVPRPIRLGPSWEDSWLVESGLAAGDRVIVEGVVKVRPGAPVVVLTREEAAAREAAASGGHGAPAARGSAAPASATAAGPSGGAR